MVLDTAIAADKNKALAEALMDYYSVPGRFALNLRQPTVVFQQFDKVIAWAQGKIGEEQAALDGVLQKAAVFFVQRACFRVENTHYDVLGLDREFSLDVLRQRYRSLISLTHPDKNISGLPSNAAVRINNAYDTLKNVDERAKYDALLSNKIEISVHTFSSVDRSLLNTVTVKDRLRPYIPNFKQTIFFVIPIVFTLCVVLLLAFGSGPRDLELVEKKSNRPRKSNPINIEDTSPDQKTNIETRVLARDAEKTDNEAVPQSSVSVFEPLTSAYQTIVRNTAKPANYKNAQNDVVQVVLPLASTETSTLPEPELTSSSMTLRSSSSMSANLSPVVDSNALRQNNTNNIEIKPDPMPSASQLAEARFNLTQLISSLERPSEIDFLQSKLARQGVSGNLFGIVLPLTRDAAVIRVDDFAFNEKLDKNHFVLNGTVSIMHATHAGQLTPYRYAVYAEFKNVGKSSTVGRFELREAR